MVAATFLAAVVAVAVVALLCNAVLAFAVLGLVLLTVEPLTITFCLGLVTGWLWDDLGQTGVKKSLARLEQWLEDWNQTYGQPPEFRIARSGGSRTF